MQREIGCCKKCLFWDVYTDRDEEDQYGYCRRHAPRSVLGARAREDHELMPAWPITDETQWCGDFQIEPVGSE